MSQLRLTYRRQLTARPEPIAVDSWVSAISPAQFTLRSEISDPGQSGAGPFCEGLTILAPYDLVEAGPRRISEAERRALLPLLTPDAG